MPDSAMQYSLSSEKKLLRAWTFGSYEQLRTRASPVHLSLCRLQRGDHSPQHSFSSFSTLHVAGCHTVTSPVWSLREQSQSLAGSPAPCWLTGLGRAPAHTVTAPSSCQVQTPALLHQPIRGGFATHTEPGLGYKCWLLHDMGYNWNIRQLLETALLLHANECFCCRIFCKSLAHLCLAAGLGTLRDDVGVAV